MAQAGTLSPPANKRYRQSAKGKATAARYRRTAKHRAWQKQYQRSEPGKAVRAKIRARYKAKQAAELPVPNHRRPAVDLR